MLQRVTNLRTSFSCAACLRRVNRSTVSFLDFRIIGILKERSSMVSGKGFDAGQKLRTVGIKVCNDPIVVDLLASWNLPASLKTRIQQGHDFSVARLVLAVHVLGFVQ